MKGFLHPISCSKERIDVSLFSSHRFWTLVHHIVAKAIRCIFVSGINGWQFFFQSLGPVISFQLGGNVALDGRLDIRRFWTWGSSTAPVVSSPFLLVVCFSFGWHCNCFSRSTALDYEGENKLYAGCKLWTKDRCMMFYQSSSQ